jgi:diguanylate cyclase (GGDEF)-like protein
MFAACCSMPQTPKISYNQKMNPLTQKNRLLWVLGAILAAGFLGISVLGFLVAQGAIRNSIVNQSLPLAGDSVYSEVQRALLRPIFIAAQMAQNTFLREWVEAGEPDNGAVVRYLGNIKKQFDANTAFFISERSKKYYYSEGILKVIDKNAPRDQWYFDFVGKNQTYELSSDPDEANKNRMTVFINYRLENADGKLLGVTGVGVSFDTLSQVINRIERRFSQRVYFTDQTGNIVLADNKRSEWRGKIQNLPGVKSIAAWVLAVKDPMQTSYMRGDSVVQVNSRFVPELGWFLLVEQDESIATAPVLRLLFINLLLGAIATALVLSLALFAINTYQRRLERLATTDALTEAKNRSLGEALLEQAHKEALREQKPLSVIVFDIDDFKRINDTHGHATGDHVLREVVKLTRATLRQSDTVVRWGGEEFLVVLKNCSLSDAQPLGIGLQSQMAQQPFVVGGKSITVTISVGIAQLESSETPEQLVKRADDAQYSAKRSGKNRVAVANLTQVKLV